jgi:hypothetical protein
MEPVQKKTCTEFDDCKCLVLKRMGASKIEKCSEWASLKKALCHRMRNDAHGYSGLGPVHQALVDKGILNAVEAHRDNFIVQLAAFKAAIVVLEACTSPDISAIQNIFTCEKNLDHAGAVFGGYTPDGSEADPFECDDE